MKALLSGKKNKGVATLEILIAFALIILCMGAVIMVVFGNQSVVIDTELNNEAIYKSKKMLEDLRAVSRLDFNLVNPYTSSEVSGPITLAKKAEVRQVDYFTKQATTTVSWTTKGKTYSVFQTTLLTSLDVAGGGTCSSILTGDWKTPSVTTYEFGKDLLGDPSSGFPITAIDVYKGKLFVSVNNSNGNNMPTLFIFSLTNPSVPTLLTSVDNDPTIKLGLNAIANSDTHAFGASAKQSNFATCAVNTCGQLQIFNTGVTPPTVVKTFKMPGVTGTAGQAIGQALAYRKDSATGKEYIYLGLTKTLSGPEFNILDVTDKSNPIYMGGYPVGYGINSLFIKDNYAYIATPNPENMTVLDISNPSSPTRVGGYSPGGGSNGESVYVVGTRVYLGRTFGTNEFNILDATNPSTPTVVANKDIGTGNTTSINSVFVRDYLAFMITNDKFEVWDISNTANIVPWTPNALVSEFQDLPGGKGTAMDCEKNNIYVGSLPTNDKGFISIITAN